VPTEEIRAAIDQKFGKWAAAANSDPSVLVKLWRVEPQKFAIQLAPVDKKGELMTLGQALSQPLTDKRVGSANSVVAKQVIYLAFADRKCGE